MTRAFAPGHVTAFFSAVPDDDPLEAGSRGAGFTVEDGVTVDVEPAKHTVIWSEGRRVDLAPVERVLDMMDVEARVEVSSTVPVGCGFGASGAATLATALAANVEFSLGLDRDQAVAAAHVAEVEAGTGLGDVVPQSIGGVVTRVEPGAPELGLFGSVEHGSPAVEYTAYGSLDTASVLGDDDRMDAVDRAGESALDGLLKDPGFERMADVSWEFALESGLPTKRVVDAVGEARSAGGKASMAMLGETAWAVGVDGVFEKRTRVSDGGARVIER
ncbi:MAG: pantoate kinase [Halobacteriales archaeon]